MGTLPSFPIPFLPFLQDGKGNESDEGHGCHEGNEGHEEEANLCKALKASCLPGKISKTKSGYTAAAFKKNKAGKIVSKKVSAQAKTVLGPWTAAVQKARKALNIKGFLAVKKGTPLYKKAKELYATEGSERSSSSL